jgi:hypothetical protein
MKGAILLHERKSQVFIAVLIAFTIVLALGAAILMHSRSARTSARLQTDVQKAYALAQSGIAIGESYLLDNPGVPFSHPYNVSGGTIQVDITTNYINSTADYKGTKYYASKNLVSGPPTATTWVKSYGGNGEDKNYFVAQTVDGGYILGGEVSKTAKDGYGAGGRDIMLIKTDELGRIGSGATAGITTWANAYGGGSDETMNFFNAVAIAPQNEGYICTAFSKSFPSSGSGEDLLLVKVNDAGDMEWARGFRGSGTDRPRAVIETQDRGYLLVADTDTKFTTVEGIAIKGLAMLLIKTDSQGHIGPDAEAGTTTWVRLYDNRASGTDTDEIPYCLAEDANNYIIFGQGWHVDADGHVLKIDKTNGNIVQQKRYGTPKPGYEYFFGGSNITGGYVITGMTNSFGPTGSGWNCFFIKLDSDLIETVPSKVYDEELLDQRGYAITPTSSGYALAVWGTTYDYLLLQTDSDGNLKPSSCRRYGGVSPQEYLNFLDATDDGVILGGYATDEYIASGTSYNWLIAKVNSSGQLTCSPGIFISKSPVSLTQTDFTLTEITGYPLTALTILPATLDDVNVGPTSQGGIDKIFQNSASGVTVKDDCS